MASSLSSILFASLLLVLWIRRSHANECYSSIISFGDSISDTGNREQLGSMYPEVGFDCEPPCGQNGRCSNGGLIIDFLADILGLPFLPPFVNDKEISGVVTGVNYAVSGASVLNASFLNTRWNGNNVINTSLGVQLSWFKQSLPSMCDNTSDCSNFMGRSLIVLGPIGSNDYNHMLAAGKQLNEIEPYVPIVVDAIISTVSELIEMGARTIIVPGNFPFGCFPAVFELFGLDNDEYDPKTGCITRFNEFAEYHNIILKEKINQTRELNPNVNIIYADIYNAALQLYLSPDKYGFTNWAFKACSGGGGLYNFNVSSGCGDSSRSICDERDAYISWDGIHYTEAAYKIIAKSLFQGPYTTPEFYSLCPTPLKSLTGVGLSSSI